MHRDIDADLNRSKMTMSGTIDVDKQRRQGRSSTLSSSGSAVMPQRMIRKGLQEVVKEYLQASLVGTLPQLEFLMGGPLPLSSSIQLEEGLCQMLDIVTAMLNQALSDQGSQGFRNAWKTNQGETTTLNKWREYVFNGKTHFSYVDEPWL